MFNRTQVTFMLGVVLVAVGIGIASAVRLISFARYMHLEDLGLDVNPAVGAELLRQIVASTAAERTLFYTAVALVPLGAVLLILGWRHRTRAAG